MTIVGRTAEAPLRRWIRVAVGLATAGSAGAQGQGTELLASDRVAAAEASVCGEGPRAHRSEPRAREHGTMICQPQHRGLTIIELLAVVAVVVCLMAAALPVIGKVRAR